MSHDLKNDRKRLLRHSANTISANMTILCAGASHLDNFPEDLKSVVHPHWGTFPPQHPLIIDLFGVIFFVLWTISFLGNGCVIYIFLSTKSMRTPVGHCFIFLGGNSLKIFTIFLSPGTNGSIQILSIKIMSEVFYL